MQSVCVSLPLLDQGFGTHDSDTCLFCLTQKGMQMRCYRFLYHSEECCRTCASRALHHCQPHMLHQTDLGGKTTEHEFTCNIINASVYIYTVSRGGGAITSSHLKWTTLVAFPRASAFAPLSAKGSRRCWGACPPPAGPGNTPETSSDSWRSSPSFCDVTMLFWNNGVFFHSLRTATTQFERARPSASSRTSAAAA